MFKYAILFLLLTFTINVKSQIQHSLGFKIVYGKEPLNVDDKITSVTELMLSPTYNVKLIQKYLNTEIEVSFSDKSVPQWKIDLELLVSPLQLISDRTDLPFSFNFGLSFDYDVGYSNTSSSAFVVNTDFSVPIKGLATRIGAEINYDFSKIQSIPHDEHTRLEFFIFLPFNNK